MFNHSKISRIIALLLINLLYASVGIFTKLASQQEFLSWAYIFSFSGAVAVIGIYAILWQQIIRKIELSTAYMFKGTTIIFTMLFAHWLFGEQITWNNIVGVAIIIIGIVLFARGDLSEGLTS
ncbi:MAG: EamA family transporter [Paludibacteraceae bacterium]|nr:EamA family transporter [Paludibacteraceae bacterium]